MSLTSREVGLTSFPPQDRPPVLIPFMTFRVMVGCGLIMLGLAWLGSWLIVRNRLERNRWLLACIFLSFPLPFIATLAGWYTAEVGRQPWVVYGVLRTAKAMTPFLTANAALTTLILFGAIYTFIFSFGTYYIYRLLRAGPAGSLAAIPTRGTPNRPMSLADQEPVSQHAYLEAGE
jgi:cytochrome d ubiquinol oxidase subunit I